MTLPCPNVKQRETRIYGDTDVPIMVKNIAGAVQYKLHPRITEPDQHKTSVVPKAQQGVARHKSQKDG